MNQACAGENEKGSVRRRGSLPLWGGLALVLMISACGGRDSQPESGTAGETADTAAAPAPPADTAAAADSATGTGTTDADSSRDTAQAPTQTARAEPTEKPAAEPKPKPAPKPAAKPEPVTTPEASADTQSAAAAEPPAQPAAPQNPQTPQEAPLRDEYHQAPRDTVSQVVYDGWKQYNLNCARCHGEDVLGTTIAPHLIVSMKPNGPINTKEAFTQVVCAGRPEKGMPSWCALGLEMDKINAVYEYVKGRSAGEIGPGRPAVKQEG
jgi:Cytochrome C oxidase, cbb3-type, subunit III